jgi:hypothetical protein
MRGMTNLTVCIDGIDIVTIVVSDSKICSRKIQDQSIILLLLLLLFLFIKNNRKNRRQNNTLNPTLD